jgi:hypothetical protein
MSYATGEGALKDYAEAVKWYRKVVGNLRVGEVLQVSSLVGSHDRTEVELIGDFETDAFAFVHRIRGTA